MLRIVVIQPGSTNFDDEGRIKGSLDLPLSVNGADQVALAAQQLSAEPIEVIYSAPNRSALQTAETIAEDRKIRVRRMEKLRNIDHGLWHGKLIEEVKQNLPKVYRRGQDDPGGFCPPEGESVIAARQRAQSVITKLLKKHKRGTVALVVPDPLASIIRGILQANDMNDVWKAEQDRGTWTMIEMGTRGVPVNHQAG